jgi:hypothetical protein
MAHPLSSVEKWWERNLAGHTSIYCQCDEHDAGYCSIWAVLNFYFRDGTSHMPPAHLTVPFAEAALVGCWPPRWWLGSVSVE